MFGEDEPVDFNTSRRMDGSYTMCRDCGSINYTGYKCKCQTVPKHIADTKKMVSENIENK